MASSSQEPTHQKKGKGKQKVRMVKMESTSNLQVTFSKRRHGLFKKASDLCTLTGSEIGLIVFSPGSKVYSFGNPSIHEIIDKSSLEACHGITARKCSILTPRSDEPNQSLSVAEANLRLSIVERQLEDAKRQMPTMEEREKAELEADMGIEGMTEEELVELSTRLIALKESMARMDKSGLAGLSHVTSLHSTPW